jgi:hypothetical protein
MKRSEAYYGGQIHKVLNNTIYRKLTIKEYMSVVENIQDLVEASRERQKDILIECIEKMRTLSK